MDIDKDHLAGRRASRLHPRRSIANECPHLHAWDLDRHQASAPYRTLARTCMATVLTKLARATALVACARCHYAPKRSILRKLHLTGTMTLGTRLGTGARFSPRTLASLTCFSARQLQLYRCPENGINKIDLHFITEVCTALWAGGTSTLSASEPAPNIISKISSKPPKSEKSKPWPGPN